MAKKGLSIEEKKHRMLELFHETGECYQLKELEKIAPKSKGIVANTVKDVIQNLVDEGLVDTDKIGSSVYFWSFPSKVVQSKKRKLENMLENQEENSKRLKLIEQTLKKHEETKIDEKTESKILAEITNFELEISSYKTKLKEFQDNDPEKLDELKKKAEVLKNSANRWIDNIFVIKSWCKNKFCIEDDLLNKQFGIPEDLDYI